jgi:tetratricopeptide (TPR) repeat protein/TolB-like protein
VARGALSGGHIQLIGKTISHYKILDKLGEGGMGVVYKAEDTKLRRTVALKFLPPEITRDRDAKTRFVHEAQAASALQHNNICTIHEIDETPEGQMFICMDYYDGETLRDRIKRGPLPLGEAIDIATNIAAGLAKAHEAGMVHRDIKPANLVVTSDGVVKVVDFGLAKLAGATRVTKTGTTVGTVAYMSPEHARGEDVDERSDIFSLGAVFYELLTGELPFKGDHEAAVMYGIANNDPPALDTYRNDLPAGLQRVIDKVLAKDVDERYQSALEFSDDIAEFGNQTDGGRAGGRSRARRNRPRWRGLVAGIVGVAIVVTVAVVLWPRLRGPGIAEAVTLAVVDFNDLTASGDSTRSIGMAGLIHVGLVENSPCTVVSPSRLMDLRRRLFGAQRGPIEESQAMEVARESGATILLSGQMGELDGRPYVAWQLVDIESGASVAARRAEGSQAGALADAVLEGVLPELAARCGADLPSPVKSVTEVITANSEAYEYFVAAGLAGEQMKLREMINLLKKAVALDSTFALAYFQMAKTYRAYRRYADARENSETAWRWRSRLSIQDLMRLKALRDQMDYRVTDAIELCREIHARWPDDKAILKELSYALYYWRYHNESLQVSRRGLVLYPDDPYFVERCSVLLSFLGRPDEALESGRDLVKRFPDNPQYWDELASRFIQVGLLDSAEVAMQRTLEMEPDWKTYMLQCFADLPYYRGDLYGSIADHEQLYEQFSDSGFLQFVYREAGRYERALELFDEGMSRRSTPTDPVDRLAREISRSRFLLSLGRAEEVLRWTDGVTEELVTGGGASDNPQLSGMVRKNIPYYRARALVAMDSLAAARTAASGLMSMAPEMGILLRNYAFRINARIAVEEGDPESALSALDQLKHAGFGGVSWARFEYTDTRAEAYRLSGRLEEAVAVHKELLRIYGGHALSHYQLGLTYEEMGRPRDAKREFTRFLEMWSEADEGLPPLVDARHRLAELTDTTP